MFVEQGSCQRAVRVAALPWLGKGGRACRNLARIAKAGADGRDQRRSSVQVGGATTVSLYKNYKKFIVTVAS